MKSTALLLTSAALCVGCTSTPIHPVPDPLPATLAWATSESSSDSRTPFLGLKTRENDTGSLDELTFDPGVRVARVIENSPAAETGIQTGDIVLRLGEHATDDPAALDALVANVELGTPISLQIQRGDTVFDVLVNLTSTSARPRPPEILYLKDASRSRAGWATAPGGVLLVSAAEDSPFPLAGIPVGSSVTAIDGEEVFSARSLIRKLETYAPGDEVEVNVHPPDTTESLVDVELYDAPRKVTGFMIPLVTNYDADPEGESTSFVLIDLYVISLFRYTRKGAEKEYRILRWFRWSSGVGELSE